MPSLSERAKKKGMNIEPFIQLEYVKCNAPIKVPSQSKMT